ncbi:hypothetical protein BGP78_15525 [Pseudoalteromonas sp. MSK9-3]|uniref:methyltransferase domain-containing protein n=1 Tax=Pseudoalteromonas sp. MSK9-3 TaxID=1897633 RepID=UPI000E6C946B|nr:methyltransferase domain-containing protein [Pseudoalteromonas sp. MSK9-3]RJE75760.1 hypothetical protein BGP78_15525 [Pseudoalteromonas sp. MSK9-3]
MGMTLSVLEKTLTYFPNSNSRVLDLGAQQVFGNFYRSEEFQLSPHECSKCNIPVKSGIYARSIYEGLGFTYKAIDLSGEDYSISIDLNYDNYQEEDSFDVVTNFGTSEHIINQVNCFKAMHDACSHNGIMIHSLPFSRFFEHGFYNYNPNLFLSLALANNYEIEYFAIVEDKNGGRIQSVFHELDSFYKYEELPLKDLLLYCVLKKTINNPFKLPQQEKYTTLSMRYAQQKNSFYANRLLELSIGWAVDIQKFLKSVPQQPFALYGGGEFSQNILSIEKCRKNVLVIIDADQSKHGTEIYGIPIISPSEVPENIHHIYLTIDIHSTVIESYLKQFSTQDYRFSGYFIGQ